MLNFNNRYHPLTSRPFLSNQSYREHPPCETLRPYIACYWGTEEGGPKIVLQEKEIRVIPDTCMDIIIRINHSRQTISGYLSGLHDQSFVVTEGKEAFITTFAIRFHFWAAHLFLDLDFKTIQNQSLDLEVLGREWRELFERLFYLEGIRQRIDWVEAFLMKRLEPVNRNPKLFNAIHRIVTVPGRESVRDICDYCCVGQRQMERIFSQKIGLPLKRVANLVRYQRVWREMVLSPEFDVQDLVYRYGYTDQAHLLNEFRRFHGTSPQEAIKFARENR